MFIHCSKFVGDSLSLPIKYLQQSIKCKSTQLQDNRTEGQVCKAESTSIDSEISTDGFDAGSSVSFRGGTLISLSWKFDFPAFYLQDMITAPNTAESSKGNSRHCWVNHSIRLWKVWDPLQGLPCTAKDFYCQPLSSPTSSDV